MEGIMEVPTASELEASTVRQNDVMYNKGVLVAGTDDAPGVR